MTRPTRRDFVRLIGAGACASRLGCGDNVTSREVAAAILEPTSDRMIVAVWARDARSAVLEIRDADDVTTVPVELDASGSGAVDLADLRPATRYAISIVVAGSRHGPYSARTAPRDDDPRTVRIAVFADVDPNPEFETDLIPHVVAADPDLLVSIGDFPYTDNGPVAETLDAYRDRHVEIRSLPSVRMLLEAAALRAIYDDHEFRNNWDAMFAAVETERYAAAMTVWDEFFPLRGAVADRRYRNWRWGANVECFLLDCRRFRSANAAPDDGHKTMLGATQLTWFQDAIARSVAPFKLVFTSVPLAFGTGDDHWSAFASERDAMLDALVGIGGVVFIAGDQHFFAAHRHRHGIREFQIGPLARGIGTPGASEPGVVFRAARYNVGLVDISADRLVVTGLGTAGERFYEESFGVEDLTPTRA